jgi:hypothetical protein
MGSVEGRYSFHTKQPQVTRTSPKNMNGLNFIDIKSVFIQN